MRRALLLAVDEYESSEFPTLGSPSSDARQLADTLQDPTLGAFDSVELHTNVTSSEMAEHIETFLTQVCSKRDEALLYFSGHGRLDLEGGLCFAATNTHNDRLLSTSVPATLVHRMLDLGPHRQLVVLDCCYSGAFPRGMAVKSTQVHAPSYLGETISSGRGRTILAASEGFKHAYESGTTEQTSIFTRAAIDGIRSGAADLGDDGLIDAAELHSYVAERMKTDHPGQTPQIWTLGGSTGFIVSRTGDTPIPEPQPIKPASNPPLPPSRQTTAAIIGAICLLLLLAGMIWLATRQDGDQTAGDPPDASLRTGTYQVSVTGSAGAGERFERDGELRVFDHGDDPFKLCLQVGNPLAPTALGAIQFGTHGDCFGDTLLASMVSFEDDDGTFVLAPTDTFTSDAGVLNSFTVALGVTTPDYIPDGGTFTISSDDRAASGTINLRGLSRWGSNTANYTASFDAQHVSDDPNEIVSGPGTTTIPPVGLSDANAVRYRVAEIVRFEQTQGLDSWIDSARTRLENSVFEIGQSEFVYAPPDARTDIYPLIGTTTSDGETMTLEGSAESTGATARVNGVLSTSDDTTVLTLTLRSATPAADGETVAEYNATVVLVER